MPRGVTLTIVDAEAWVVAAEGVLGVALAGWAVRPVAWSKALVHNGSHEGVRLTASADELADADVMAVETWATSSERATFMKRAGRVNSAVAGSLLVVASGVTLATRFPAERVYGVEIGVLGLLMLVASGVPVTAARMAYQERQKAVATTRVDDAIGQLAKPDNLTLGNLFTLNRRQLDQYQELTRRQQRSAFRLTQVTSVVAFAALIAGVVFTFAAPTTTDKFLTGGLAALGSALSAFLASTFFKAHKSANQQLNRYYLEPQRTGRLLAAERLATREPSLEPATMATILTAILSWEMPPAGHRKAPSPASTKDAAPAPAAAPAAASPNGATATTG